MAEGSTRQRSYQATDETAQLLNELKVAFKLPSDSAVIRRALGLARLIAREAKDDHTITIERKDGSQVTLVLDA